jgi:hypothetical protein
MNKNSKTLRLNYWKTNFIKVAFQKARTIFKASFIPEIKCGLSKVTMRNFEIGSSEIFFD